MKRQKPETEKYDDPLGLDDNTLPEQTLPLAPVVLTGISEEEDAHRHVGLRLNPALMFCPNCEGYYDVEGFKNWCPYCGDTLRPVGAAPRSRKFSMR